ncbi:MAG: dockerin type I domain-containing protein, partial [Clostridia bacterium]|nr:dockerin type I domain-containing protein [Clostridia bacterium]
KVIGTSIGVHTSYDNDEYHAVVYVGDPVAQIGETKYGSLSDALDAAQAGDTVTLLSDVVLESDLQLGTGTNGFNLNLNGYTIDGGENWQVYTAGNGTINIYGGTIKNNKSAAGASSAALYIFNGSKVTLDCVDIIGNYTAVANYGDLTIKSANITAEKFGIGCFGSGLTTFGAENADNSGIVVNSGWSAIASSVEYSPAPNVTVYGGIYKTTGTNWDEGPVYWAGAGTINIYGGTFQNTTQDTGAAGIYQKNGNVNIYGGTFNAKDGFKLETKSFDVSAKIYDGSFTGVRSGIYINASATVPSNYDVAVSGGNFTGGSDCLYDKTAGLAQGQKLMTATGGTFNEKINNDYIADKYYAKDNGNGTYTVTYSPATVIESEKTISAEVTLNGLRNNSAIDHEPDAVYSVEVSNAPKEEKEKIEVAAGTSKNNLDVMDIKVKKTVDGESEYVSGIENQKVTITLQNNATDKPVVYYIDNGSATAIEDSKVTWSNAAPNVVSFIAPHFSTYAVSYNAAAVSAGDITPNVSVAFEAVTPNEYDIVLKADSGKKINRFMSADLTFAYASTEGAVSYNIAPVNMVNLIDKGDGRYEFNLDGINASGATGDSIKIGTVTFEGYGTGKFNVAGVTTNIVNTAEKDDNIVAYYVPNGGTGVGTLITNNAVADNKGQIDVELTAPKKTLTVNVAYNNRAENQVTGYQNMTVKISGGDLSNPIEIALGDYPNVAENPYNVTFTENADKTTSYNVTIADTLTKNVTYTVTVEGLGYRTARHTVTMTEDKILNFWNNVKDATNAIAVEAGKDTTTKNFLAGDIVKDNNINIYDLSAVVSYFGKGNLASAEETYSYAKYDLNRDGVIDSKDVAYVLVSWGE